MFKMKFCVWKSEAPNNASKTRNSIFHFWRVFYKKNWDESVEKVEIKVSIKMKVLKKYIILLTNYLWKTK